MKRNFLSILIILFTTIQGYSRIGDSYDEVKERYGEVKFLSEHNNYKLAKFHFQGKEVSVYTRDSKSFFEIISFPHFKAYEEAQLSNESKNRFQFIYAVMTGVYNWEHEDVLKLANFGSYDGQEYTAVATKEGIVGIHHTNMIRYDIRKPLITGIRVLLANELKNEATKKALEFFDKAENEAIRKKQALGF